MPHLSHMFYGNLSKRSSLVLMSRLGINSDQLLVVIVYGQVIECHLTFMRGELHIVIVMKKFLLQLKG